MSSVTVLRTNRRPRAGRMFAPVAERKLEPAARRVLEQLPGVSLGLLAVKEVAGPFGVPDIVAVVGPPSKIAARRRAGVDPLLNEIDAGIVAAASTSTPQSVARIAARLGWPVAAVTRRIPQLMRSGALEMSERGTIVKVNGLEPVGQIFAIEMKVNNWRRAITQCRTYRLWADSYVLVLGDVSPSGRVAVIEAVKSDRGGLVIGGELVLRPKLTRLEQRRRLWGSEHVFAATLAPLRKPNQIQPSDWA